MECQLETLRSCRNLKEVKVALSQLPSTLDGTYDRILNNIEEKDRRVAYCALQLVAFSYRSLTIVEVAEATSVNIDEQSIDADLKLFHPHDILKICSTFIELKYVLNSYLISDIKESTLNKILSLFREGISRQFTIEEVRCPFHNL